MWQDSEDIAKSRVLFFSFVTLFAKLVVVAHARRPRKQTIFLGFGVDMVSIGIYVRQRVWSPNPLETVYRACSQHKDVTVHVRHPLQDWSATVPFGRPHDVDTEWSSHSWDYLMKNDMQRPTRTHGLYRV